MNRSLLLMASLLLIVVTNRVSGQIVQLPTIRYFSVATTVIVPDRGSMFLGGVDRASYGSSTVGVPGLSRVPGAGRLFTNRGIGSEVSSTRAYASATIMDLGELDEAVLAEAAARRGASPVKSGSANPETERRAAFIAKHIAKTDRSRLGTAPQTSNKQKQK